MWLLARTVSRTWLDTAMLGQSIQRVVRGLDAALLERVVVEVGVGSLVT